MSFSPGKNVGRVSIRVVPDTTQFRRELKRALDRFEKTTHFTVNVDKAKLDNEKIRASIQEQFDRMKDIRVNIAPYVSKENEDQFHHQIDRMVRKASGKNVNIDVKARTAAASQKLRLVSRDRISEIFVKVNKAALAKAAATLGALSGARLSGSYLDDIWQFARDLDKNLPKILTWASALTALGSGIVSSVSGLVGIGAGLVHILPTLLVVPGLILNAAGSLTVMVVALKNAKTELSALSGDMSDLGNVINTEFWDRAQKPIVNLVKTLMPQLRAAFRDLSAGVGDFTAKMAAAFKMQLSGGRLKAIFKGIGDGWRILGKGANAFAGALVSLSEIAAHYTPRLASWLVRQANTFDKWLTKISTNKSLSKWMEDAISSMYDLWDATRGTVGVLQGLWKAADAAGSGGLHGFAQMMLDWKKTVNGGEFQRAMQAVFRGSSVAVGAFNDAVKNVGHLIGSMPDQFEHAIGSLGGGLGKIISAFAKALNNPTVAAGLEKFASGIDQAVPKIIATLGPISKTIGNLLGLIGTMANTILPAAVTVVSTLAPAIDAVISGVEKVLPKLTSTFSDAVKDLGPSVTGLVKALTPALVSGIRDLANALGPLSKILGPLLDGLANTLQFLSVGSAFGTSPLGILFGGDINTRMKNVMDTLREIKASGSWLSTLIPNLNGIQKGFDDASAKVGMFLTSLLTTGGRIVNFFRDLGPKLMLALANGLDAAFPWASGIIDKIFRNPAATALAQNAGTDMGNMFVNGLRGKTGAASSVGSSLAKSFLDAVKQTGPAASAGANAGQQFASGARGKTGSASSAGSAVGAALGGALAGVGKTLNGIGSQSGGQYARGARGKAGDARSAGSGLGGALKGAVSGINLYSSGQSIVSRFISGIRSMITAAAKAASAVASAVRGMFPNSPAKTGPFSGAGWTKLGKSGAAVAEQFTTGLLRSIPNVRAASTALMSAFNTDPRISLTAYQQRPDVGTLTRLGVGVASQMSRSSVATTVPTVHVYVGNEEITSRVRVVVDSALSGVARSARQGGGR